MKKLDSQTIAEDERKELIQIYDELDGISAYDFIRKYVKNEWLVNMLAVEADTLQGGDAKNYSAENLLGYESLLGNIRFYMNRQENNIDGYRVPQGMEQIVLNMKQELQALLEQQG